MVNFLVQLTEKLWDGAKYWYLELFLFGVMLLSHENV